MTHSSVIEDAVCDVECGVGAGLPNRAAGCAGVGVQPQGQRRMQVERAVTKRREARAAMQLLVPVVPHDLKGECRTTNVHV